MFGLTEASTSRRAVDVTRPIAASSGSILASESFMLKVIIGNNYKPVLGGTCRGSIRTAGSVAALMTKTLDRIQTLVAHNEVRVSLHGSEELAADDVQVRDVIAGVATAVMVEDYPDYPKGHCCLVLQRDAANRPVHVVWGIPSGRESPAVVVTAYRPDPLRWDQTWRRRRK